MNGQNSIITLALGILIGLSINALPLQPLFENMFNADSRLNDYSLCIRKQSSFLSKRNAEHSCFRHYAKMSSSDAIGGRMGSPRVPDYGEIVASPRVENDTSSFVALTSVIARYEIMGSTEPKRPFTFDCDLKIIPPFSSSEVSCRSTNETHADEIRKNVDNKKWKYSSWTMGSSLKIDLDKSDY